ncbi:MAG: DUF1351 domain-containing protein, partial [Firmicutes bacterium]|nr:DUF1351 domain-containing protein [Bacillota bacterium]
VKEIKIIRAELNKEFAEWEEKRKAVKKAVSEPYEKFEVVYKDCVSDIYKYADKELKTKIDDVQEVLKERKKEEILAFFEEHKKCDERYNFLTFARTGINITLSASASSLKQKVSEFFDAVRNDLDFIDTQSDRDEILVEYQKTLKLSAAMAAVQERKKALEMVKQSEQPQETAQADKPLTKPVEIDEKVYTVAFKVRATKQKIKELKKFLIDGGYDYE